MTAHLVRLKLSRKLLTYAWTLELRHHLEYSLSQLSGSLTSRGQEKLLDGLTFLLNNPLFLYAVAPRIRRTNSDSHVVSTTLIERPEVSLRIDLHELALATGFGYDCCFTELRYGDATLIMVQDLSARREEGCQQSFIQFLEEVEFLEYECRAREEAATEALGLETIDIVGTKIVKLRVGDKGIVAKEKNDLGRIQKEGKLKLRWRL